MAQVLRGMNTWQAPAGAADMLEGFRNHLSNGSFNATDLSTGFDLDEARRSGKPLQKLWEFSELSANDFANEVARFFGLRRVALAELMAAPPLADRFSHRFLRESAVFPYQGADEQPRLVVGDPADASALRAAEIVLGAPLMVEVAAFEDIETVLGARLEGESAPALAPDREIARAGEDVDSLRDLASGAPVVRAVNDLLEKAVELRATDIHIEPFRAVLVVRMRVDGVLRTMPTPA